MIYNLFEIYLYELFLFYRDSAQSNTDYMVFEFNMSSLTGLLRRQAEQNPTASYFNVDILKYQVCGRNTLNVFKSVLLGDLYIKFCNLYFLI